MKTNSVLVAAALVLVLAIGFGVGMYVNSGDEQVQNVGTSSTGSTFSTAKISEVVMTPVSSSATSSAILNTDSSARVITDGGIYCEGAQTAVKAQTGTGLLEWVWSAATSSTATPVAGIITNTVPAFRISVATGTNQVFVATSTWPSIGGQVWASGSYLVIQPNATSSTAVCTPFVHYIAT